MRRPIVFHLTLAGLLAIFGWMGFSGCQEPPQSGNPVTPEHQKVVLGKGEVFVAYDEPPTPIGGFEAIHKNLRYPASARAAGLQGRVILNVLINKNGEVEMVKVLKSTGHEEMDQAAIEAVKKTAWSPARQKGSPVKVWVGIPVIFKLKDGQPVQGREIRKELDPNRYQPPYPNNKMPYYDRLRPILQKKGELEGKVPLKLLFSEDGEIMEAEIDESSRSHPALEEAALELVKQIPWLPARKNQQPVASEVSMTVHFDRKAYSFSLKGKPIE
ncbi:MAG: energy transducer TonB [candidate division KSB1 bacterium]|nr:energy transducer TonB [candidate division KSB1 bacterium]